MSCRLALQARIPAPWPQTLLRWPAVGVPQAVASARRYSSVLAHRALIVVVRPSRYRSLGHRAVLRPAVLHPAVLAGFGLPPSPAPVSRRRPRSGAEPGRSPVDAPPVRGSQAWGAGAPHDPAGGPAGPASSKVGLPVAEPRRCAAGRTSRTWPGSQCTCAGVAPAPSLTLSLARRLGFRRGRNRGGRGPLRRRDRVRGVRLGRIRPDVDAPAGQACGQPGILPFPADR